MKNTRELIEDYQELIHTMDEKLSLYEQLGTPEGIAEKLNVELIKTDPSERRPVKTTKGNPTRSQDLDEATGDSKPAELENDDKPDPLTKTRAQRLVEGFSR